MVNKQKIKGTRWEQDAVRILSNLIEDSSWKRIPSSGAIGTQIDEPLLTGDISGIVNGFNKRIRGECKVGYNPSSNKEVKSFSLKKEWLDKIKSEANLTNSLPIVLGKFDNAYSGVKHFVVLDIKDFAEVMTYICDLSRELELLYNEQHKRKMDGDKKETV